MARSSVLATGHTVALWKTLGLETLLGLRRVRAKDFHAVIAAPPCSTFSVSRFFKEASDGQPGPPAIRTRTHPEGITNVPPDHVKELRLANLLVTRTCRLLTAATEVGSEFILENPADRGDPGVKYYFLNERHAPLWEMPEIKVLQEKTSAQQISFPMCELGHQSGPRN